jgi:hypothetical protein
MNDGQIQQTENENGLEKIPVICLDFSQCLLDHFPLGTTLRDVDRNSLYSFAV